MTSNLEVLLAELEAVMPGTAADDRMLGSCLLGVLAAKVAALPDGAMWTDALHVALGCVKEKKAAGPASRAVRSRFAMRT